MTGVQTCALPILEGYGCVFTTRVNLAEGPAPGPFLRTLPEAVRASLHKKKMEQIKEENKAIGRKIMQEQVDSLDYKKKLKSEIKEYLELRDSIRKCKPAASKHQSSKSDRKKSVGVKLDKLKEDK